MFRVALSLLLFTACLFGSTEFRDPPVSEKVLICGIAKNIESNLEIVLPSIEMLGEQFEDYRVVIFENNSSDQTRSKLLTWARVNPKVIFEYDDYTRAQLKAESEMKVKYRTFIYAKARNKVLDVIMRDEFDDYAYVVMADLDHPRFWDIENILDSILNPEHEWDGILGNGAYDKFAFRHKDFPVGFELIGDVAWDHLIPITHAVEKANLYQSDGPWFPVYSAFGGMGIYKRDSIKGCRYSGVVTKELEQCVIEWLNQADIDAYLVQEYFEKCMQVQRIDLYKDYLADRESYPDKYLAIRLCNQYGLGQVYWLSCHPGWTLPWTCEHITFHAAMAARGHGRLFVNPRLKTNRT